MIHYTSKRVITFQFLYLNTNTGADFSIPIWPLNRKTCTVLGKLNVEGVALATGAHFISIMNDNEIENGIAEALKYQVKENRCWLM